jgi:hypothetical protein
MPHIPPKANHKWKNGFSPVLYRVRNAIERMFCRLGDFRRVATRHDRTPSVSRRGLHRRSHQILVMGPDPSMIQIRAGRGTFAHKNAGALTGQPRLSIGSLDALHVECDLL